MKILIADDSRVMRQIVVRTLRQAGFGDHDLIEAADGKQAFELAKSENPDLVLSDWNMPEMTGDRGAAATPRGGQRRQVRLRHVGVHAGDAASGRGRRVTVFHRQTVHS